MARPAKMKPEEMLKYAKACYVTECNSVPELLTIPKIGKYIRAQGYDIGDHLVRRNSMIREYIDELNHKNSDLTTVGVFKDMDIDEMLKKNSTPQKMKQALMDRQDYYMELTRSSAVIFEENRALKAKVEQLEAELGRLEEEVSNKSSSSSEIKKNYKEVMKNNRILMDIIDTYVYPEIANELLAKNGFIKKTAGYLNPEKVQENVIGAGDSIKKIKSNVVRGLFSSIGGDLDDEDD